MSTPSDGSQGQPPWNQPSQGQQHGQPGYGQPAGQQYAGQQYGRPGYGQGAEQPAYAGAAQAPYGTQPGPGQPPFGAYPGTLYGEPQRKSRRPLFLIIGGAVAAVVVLLVVLGAVIGTGNPRDTADEFMAALKAKNVDKAHSLLCKDGKDKETVEELRKDFDLDTRTITNYALGTETDRKRDGNDETLIPVTIDYDQGSQVKLEIGLWNEGGQKVCSLNQPGGS